MLDILGTTVRVKRDMAIVEHNLTKNKTPRTSTVASNCGAFFLGYLGKQLDITYRQYNPRLLGVVLELFPRFLRVGCR